MSMFIGFFKRKHLIACLLIGLLVLGGLLSTTSVPSAEAAETVNILSQTVYCDRIEVTYEVIFATSTDYAILTSPILIVYCPRVT